MASTKIVNISKTDTFEEVFGEVQKADAKEVILIIPRGSKLARQAGYFEAFSKEAESSAKLISIMTEDPKVEEYAHANDIHVLANPKKAIKKISTIKFHTPAVQLAKDEDLSDKKQPNDESELNETINDLRVQTAVWTEKQESEALGPQVVTTASRSLQDIVREEPESSLKVRHESKKEIPVTIKKSGNSGEGSYREDKVEELWAEKRQEAKKKHNRSSFTKGSLMKKIIGGIVILVLLFSGAFFLIPANAKITIQAKKENVDIRINVVSSPNFSGVNLTASQIPGQKFTVSKEVSETFPATGQKEVAQKAHGTIKIFNNNVGQPQRLVATTRFETPEGLVFRIPATINVPGATKTSDGKINPGTLESEVYADRPGPDYNIKPASFKIPGFKGLPQYDQFSAVSSAPMSGGVVGPSKVVTEEDFSKAKNSLEQKLKEQIHDGLKEQITDMTLIEQGNNIKLDSPVANAKAGEAVESLNMKIKGNAEIVAFRDGDLDQVISNYLNKKGSLGLAHSQLKKDFESATYDPKTSQLTFTVHITGSASVTIDDKKVTTDIAGMKSDEIKTYFGGIKELSSAKVVLSPFWVNRVPKDTNHIRLTVE